MTISLAPHLIRSRIGKLAAHIVVALVALVVIGGATRVMEAGLACPDWPLCYGSLFPKGQMNVKVFLEWFHRLDALFVSIAIFLQLLFSLIYKSSLPKWLPWVNGLLVFLIALQGSLGAFTVVLLLPSTVVMAHLLLGLILVSLMSGLAQSLLSPDGSESPLWWKLLSGSSLLAVFCQSLIGSRMATTWSVQRCLNNGVSCQWLDLHRLSAVPVILLVMALLLTAISVGGWFRAQWPSLVFVLGLIVSQIAVGAFSVYLHLNEPSLRVLHQLLACLLVACLSSLYCRKPIISSSARSPRLGANSLEVCHG